MKRGKFLDAHPWCQCIGCKRASRDVHHKRGRGRFYLDESTWMAVCRDCHTNIHANPAGARRAGYLLPR